VSRRGRKAEAGAAAGEATAVDGGAPAGPPQIRVSAHPRARAAIRRTRGWAGIAGFFLVALLSLHAGVPGFDATMRALLGGLAAHFGAWICAVALWRRLVIAELELERRRRFGEPDAEPAT
jgi:hypothetical protein